MYCFGCYGVKVALLFVFVCGTAVGEHTPPSLCAEAVLRGGEPKLVTLFGATGRVGQALLQQFLADPWFGNKTVELAGSRSEAKLLVLEGQLNQEAIGRGVGTRFVARPAYQDIRGEVLVVAAGADVDPRHPTMSREDLARLNSPLFDRIVDSIVGRRDYFPSAVIIVSNPHEHALHKFRRLKVRDPGLVLMGMGSYLDSQRYQRAIADKLGVAPSQVVAYVTGQHGPRMVPLSPLVEVSGPKIREVEWSHGERPRGVMDLVVSALTEGIASVDDELRSYSPRDRIMREPAVRVFTGGSTSEETATATLGLLKDLFSPRSKLVSAHVIEEESLPIGRLVQVGQGKLEDVDLTAVLPWDVKVEMQLARQAIHGSLEVTAPAATAFDSLLDRLLTGRASRERVLGFLDSHANEGGGPVIELSESQAEKLDKFLLNHPPPTDPTKQWGWIGYGGPESGIYAKPVYGEAGEAGAVLIVTQGEACESEEFARFLGPLHYHSGAAHVSIVLEGEGYFFIETDTPRGRRILKIPVKKGSVALIPPYAVHTFYTGKSGTFEVLAFTTRMVRTDSPAFRQDLTPEQMASYQVLPYERSHFPSLGSSVLQSLRSRYGDSWSPRRIKDWERDQGEGEILKHPLVKGTVDFSDPVTWKFLPDPPEPGEAPIEGLWVVGPLGELVMAPNVWVFRTSGGDLVSVPDWQVSWEGMNAKANWMRHDGTVEALTDLIGDLGHTTLAAAIPGNGALAVRMAGDYRLGRDEAGETFLEINNISGRYMDRPEQKRVSTAQLDAFVDELARLYDIDSTQVQKKWIEGPPPPGREVRYH